MTLKNNKIYIGTKEFGWIAKSTDLGKTWYFKYDKLYPYNENANISDIFVFGSRILVSLSSPNPENNGIYYSDDEMESFKRASINGSIKGNIQIYEYNDILYATSTLYANSTSEGYISLDSGITWNSINQPFSQYTPQTLIIEFNDNIIIAGGFLEANIIISLDAGINWRKKDEGLPTYPNCLTILGDYVFAGTSLGIYRARLDELTAVDDSEIKQVSIRIIPNPFSEKTRISFNLEEPSFAKITIYNSLGFVIDVLADEYLSEGQHEFTFDGSALPSGTYYYLLHVNGKVESGKLVMIK